MGWDGMFRFTTVAGVSSWEGEKNKMNDARTLVLAVAERRARVGLEGNLHLFLFSSFLADVCPNRFWFFPSASRVVRSLVLQTCKYGHGVHVLVQLGLCTYKSCVATHNPRSEIPDCIYCTELENVMFGV